MAWATNSLMRRPPGRPQDWRTHKGEWWPGQGQGAETWRYFGRRMLIGGILFLGFMALVIVGIVAVVAYAVSGLRGIGLAALLPVAAVILVVMMARRFIRTWRPVRSLIGAAGSLADGDYSVRVSPGGSATMRPVVASFNDMAGRLESADEQRRQLLADLGHELRTPLTVIRGEIEAMLDGVHQPDQDNLELLVAEVEVMERLLEDLRTLSLIDAGSLDLHPEPTDIDQLLSDVAEGHRRRAAEAGVTIEVDEASEVGEIVIDPVRIREVLANLVVNSLRAMPDGGTLRLRATPAGNGAVIEVSDTGVGIESEDLDRVFDRFHKSAASPGSGLGLTISRDLVAAHGGTLRIESEHGTGTVATIDLSTIAPGTAA